MSQTRQRHPNLTVGSQVDTTTESREGTSSTLIRGTLRLRGESATDSEQTGEQRPSTRRIRWSEDVVNNEGMGKKSSKVCCIYHKNRPVGESSSESSSSDSSSSDTESDSDSDVVNGQDKAIRGRRSNEDGDSTSCPSSHHHKRKSKRRKPSPNAYEKIPKSATKGYLGKHGT
ncbi:hypothetical protein VTN77DRAFT_3008 [Rasamsonia byssochlamydoides]|uniref:uncharacterized protein n=1 Tax=Rasamsonia byssochlamydoides TaxID=89139 RepID=UPI0037430EEE